MRYDCRFRFVDSALNRLFIARVKKSLIAHFIDENCVVHYPQESEAVMENDIITSVRNRVFPRWQVLTCPPDWVERYRHYMTTHGIPFREELSNNELWFLIPRECRPHQWKKI